MIGAAIAGASVLEARVTNESPSKTLFTEGATASGTFSSVTASSVNGSGGGRTYSWSKVSGSAQIDLGKTSGFAEMDFDCTSASVGTHSAIFECVVTDSATGATSTTPQVTMEFTVSAL